MKVTSYNEHTFENWYWNTPDVTGIGGSETAAIETAERLAQRGHDVHVYAPVPWAGKRTAPRGSVWEHCDHVDTTREGFWIINRAPKILDRFTVEHPGQRLYFLAEDTDYPELTSARAEKLEKYICLCQAHAEYVARHYPFVKDKIVIGANGVKRELIDQIAADPPERNPRRLMYASSPDRGLLPLLKIFRRCREWVHDLELHVFYGFNNILTAHKMIGSPPNDPWYRIYQECMREMDQPGVFWHERTPQPELLREWFESGIWCHPSSFNETNAITCQDAQACGAIPIVLPNWAIGEYVQHGVFLPGSPADPLTRARFVGEIYKMVAQPELQEAIRAEMMPYARQRFDWERSVDRYEGWMGSRQRFSVIYLDYHTDDRLSDMRAKSRSMVMRFLDGAEFIPVNMKGQARAVNAGLAQAHGEYLVVISNDVYVDDPHFLEKLAVQDTVTAYAGVLCHATGQMDLALDLYCIPRSVYEALGRYWYDEVYAEGYGWDDWDALARTRKAGFQTKITPVRAQHVAASSTFRAHYDEGEFRRMGERNRDIFMERWAELMPEGGWRA